jgi:hypothetical protein
MRGLFARTLPVKCRLLFGSMTLPVDVMVDVADRTSVRMSREAGLIDVSSFDLASKDIEYASFSLSFCPSLSLVMNGRSHLASQGQRPSPIVRRAVCSATSASRQREF